MPLFVLPGEQGCLENLHEEHVEDSLVVDDGAVKGSEGNVVIRAVFDSIPSVGNVPCCLHDIRVAFYFVLISLAKFVVKYCKGFSETPVRTFGECDTI